MEHLSLGRDIKNCTTGAMLIAIAKHNTMTYVNVEIIENQKESIDRAYETSSLHKRNY
jgi:hypothetical protein